MTALRLLVTLVLLSAPFLLYVAATARGKADNALWLMYPIVLAIPTAIGGLFVLAPLEAILDARGARHLKDVVIPAAGGALVLLVLGVTWQRGRRRRAAAARRATAGRVSRRRPQLWAFLLGGVIGVVWGALWRLSEWIARVILTGHA